MPLRLVHVSVLGITDVAFRVVGLHEQSCHLDAMHEGGKLMLVLFVKGIWQRRGKVLRN